MSLYLMECSNIVISSFFNIVIVKMIVKSKLKVLKNEATNIKITITRDSSNDLYGSQLKNCTVSFSKYYSTISIDIPKIVHNL